MTPDEPLDEAAIRAAMDEALKEAPPPPRRRRRESEGDDPHLHRGTITGIDGRDVFVELGPRTQGVISTEEFEVPPQVGETFEFSLVSIQDNLWTLSRKEARTLATWQSLEKGRHVKATVIGENSGGLELKIGPVSAFMPASEIDLKRVEDFLPYVGQTLICEVMDVDRRRKRVTLSRRAVLGRERKEARERTLESLSVGQVVRGTVEKLESFGAFVDIGGGVTGLLHVSNISHQRVEDPAHVLSVGQPVECQVLEIKDGGKRVGLGTKQLQEDPWQAAAQKYKPEQVVKGKVVRIAEFGAFVELEPGLEGLVHRSQLAPERVRTVGDVLKVGEEITVRVVQVDARARRVGLSRVSARGALIGSEEDLASDDVKSFLSRPDEQGRGTNLGALLREALEKKSKGS